MPNTTFSQDLPNLSHNNHYKRANNENVNCLAVNADTHYTNK